MVASRSRSVEVALLGWIVVGSIGCDPGPVADAALMEEAAKACSGSRAGRACDDGNPCTFGDVCSRSGVCAGTAYACEDGNVCTDDACDGLGGCAHAPNSAPCDDGRACTNRDVCAAGVCAGIAGTEICGNGLDDDCDGLVDAADPDCAASCSCDDGNPCTDDRCDAGGGCTFAANANACDDANACTVDDRCSAGICRGTSICGGTPEACNGIDDNGDGVVDEGCCRPGPEVLCDNGIDDDCDGATDAADGDCRQTCDLVETDCANGKDDDCDGLVDASDPDCRQEDCGFGCPPGYVCAPEGCVAHCFNGIWDGVEDDVDCGGNCPLFCRVGQHCWSPYGCSSHVCEGDVCQPGSCALAETCGNGVDDDCTRVVDDGCG